MKRRTFLMGCAGCAAAGALGFSALRKNARGVPVQLLEQPLKLAVLADLHYLAPALTDHGPYFEAVIRNAAGNSTRYK